MNGKVIRVFLAPHFEGKASIVTQGDEGKQTVEAASQMHAKAVAKENDITPELEPVELLGVGYAEHRGWLGTFVSYHGCYTTCLSEAERVTYKDAIRVRAQYLAETLFTMHTPRFGGKMLHQQSSIGGPVHLIDGHVMGYTPDVLNELRSLGFKTRESHPLEEAIGHLAAVVDKYIPDEMGKKEFTEFIITGECPQLNEHSKTTVMKCIHLCDLMMHLRGTILPDGLDDFDYPEWLQEELNSIVKENDRGSY